ncbi:MAG: gliding motility-associated C-terminal domain-containing protein [Bacteroidales bacterium]|nr:gliding motility-associated C-terminal domain-containing protein [Bacteroidales bacterium]MBN2748832.1 gliding motility-associated C-terminal domain-containing protein [Bacteroidales bacterium]
MGRLAKYLLVTVASIITSFAALAQEPYFSIQLNVVDDPSTKTLVTFTPNLPETATLVRWEFGDGTTSTEVSPTHEYAISTSDFTKTVLLVYSIGGVESTYTQEVMANSAFFTVGLDPNLDSLATFKRIFRSAFLVGDNEAPGSMRFAWTINGESHTNANYPNLYYTFPNGGTYSVKLSVWNSSNSTNTINYEQTVEIKTVFGTTKVPLENVPNVFTPNGDGINDFFEVQTSGLSRMVLRVFTRSGALVHQNTANVIQWDGKNQMGNELPEGIYFYVIEDLDNNYETAKGFVYILKGNN